MRERRDQAKPRETRTRRRSKSMHEDVPVWYDCCSCEAEPYWVEGAAASEAEPEHRPRPPSADPEKGGQS